MSALHELLKEIPSDYDEVDVANHLLHFREAAAAELAALTQRLEAAEAERDALKELLKKSEFAGEGFCWSCGIYFGHDEGVCELQAALRGDA